MCLTHGKVFLVYSEGPDRTTFEIAGLCIEAITDPRKWTTVCERLGEHCEALFALVFEFDPATQSAPIFHSPDNLDSAEELIERFKLGAADDEPRSYEAIARQAVGAFCSEAELLGVQDESEIPHNAFTASYFPLVGAVARGAARLNDIGPFLDTVTLHFDHGSEDIPAHVRRDIALLGPILGKALEAGRVVRSLHLGYATLLEAFDHLDCGAVICEADGHIAISNSSFQQMARDRDAVMDVGGVVTAVNDRSRVDLERVIARAARTDAPSRELVASLDRRSGQLPVIVRATPLRSPAIRSDKTFGLLLFIDPEDQRRLSSEGLAAFGLLSPAELEVCEHLVQGRSTEEIAWQRETSLETTRRQIKSASAKLLCTSRLDLVRLALSTRAPVVNTEGTRGRRART